MAVAVIPALADAPRVRVVTRLAGSVHTGELQSYGCFKFQWKDQIPTGLLYFKLNM